MRLAMVARLTRPAERVRDSVDNGGRWVAPDAKPGRAIAVRYSWRTDALSVAHAIRPTGRGQGGDLSSGVQRTPSFSSILIALAFFGLSWSDFW